jgi:hypothetical protein
MNFISTDGGRSWFTAPEDVEPSPHERNGDAATEQEEEEDAPVGLDRLRTPEADDVAPLIDL